MWDLIEDENCVVKWLVWLALVLMALFVIQVNLVLKLPRLELAFSGLVQLCIPFRIWLLKVCRCVRMPLCFWDPVYSSSLEFFWLFASSQHDDETRATMLRLEFVWTWSERLVCRMESSRVWSKYFSGAPCATTRNNTSYTTVVAVKVVASIRC